MRVLLIGDSNCRELSADFMALVPDISVRIVSVGRRTSLVRDEYMRQLPSLLVFMPEYIILHSGHNDVSYHWRYNTDPSRLEDFYPYLESFITRLHEDHPTAQMFVSSLFPRSTGPGFGEEARLIYNRLSVRCGELTRSSGNKHGYTALLNNPLWISVRKRAERSTMFMSDGLHLSPEGSRAVVQYWVTRMGLV
jgi:lysophospholipase L1-like esterase